MEKLCVYQEKKFGRIDSRFRTWIQLSIFFIFIGSNLNHEVTVLKQSSPVLPPLQGAAIISMLEKMVGKDTIRAGLTNYLKKHRFGNAVTGDLWQAISEAWNGTARNFSIPEMMDSWTLQMGYPIIIFEQQNATNIYTIRQEKFLKATNVRTTITFYF